MRRRLARRRPASGRPASGRPARCVLHSETSGRRNAGHNRSGQPASRLRPAFGALTATKCRTQPDGSRRRDAARRSTRLEAGRGAGGMHDPGHGPGYVSPPDRALDDLAGVRERADPGSLPAGVAATVEIPLPRDLGVRRGVPSMVRKQTDGPTARGLRRGVRMGRIDLDAVRGQHGWDPVVPVGVGTVLRGSTWRPKGNRELALSSTMKSRLAARCFVACITDQREQQHGGDDTRCRSLDPHPTLP